MPACKMDAKQNNYDDDDDVLFLPAWKQLSLYMLIDALSCAPVFHRKMKEHLHLVEQSSVLKTNG